MPAVVRIRWLTAVLALLSASAFSMSVQGGRWWVIGEAEIGPFGAKRCFEGSCVPAGLSWLGAGERWIRFGMATWAAGLIAALVLVVMAARLAVRRVPRLAAKTALVAIATATITGGVFFAQFPGDYDSEPARGVLLFGIAIVLGAASAIQVLRTRPD